jgi:uncharacterized protein YukE
MDEIFYNYGSNFAHLDDINGCINHAEGIREDLHKGFAALGDVYQGEAAGALQAAHQHCSGQMDGHICDMRSTHSHGVDRQCLTQQQDHQGAQGFC